MEISEYCKLRSKKIRGLWRFQTILNYVLKVSGDYGSFRALKTIVNILTTSENQKSSHELALKNIKCIVDWTLKVLFQHYSAR
jgi:hypothetical protein